MPSDSRNASRPSLAYQPPSPDGRFGFHVSGGLRESKSKDHRSLARIAASSDSHLTDDNGLVPDRHRRVGSEHATVGRQFARQRGAAAASPGTSALGRA